MFTWFLLFSKSCLGSTSNFKRFKDKERILKENTKSTTLQRIKDKNYMAFAFGKPMSNGVKYLQVFKEKKTTHQLGL